jgi:sec-independent protein translocase protein TatB
MFDMSWGEVLVIGGVALIVIGPKDLPKALRTLGQMTTIVRQVAGDARAQLREVVREAELEDVKKQIAGVNQSVRSVNASFDPMQAARDEVKGAIEKEPLQSAASLSADVPTVMIGPGAQRNPADPTHVASVELPVVPLPPREPLLPASAEPDLRESAVQSLPA